MLGLCFGRGGDGVRCVCVCCRGGGAVCRRGGDGVRVCVCWRGCGATLFFELKKNTPPTLRDIDGSGCILLVEIFLRNAADVSLKKLLKSLAKFLILAAELLGGEVSCCSGKPLGATLTPPPLLLLTLLLLALGFGLALAFGFGLIIFILTFYIYIRKIYCYLRDIYKTYIYI
jgi:hypothetical protein